MHIDPSHPRAKSLKIREQLVKGIKLGLTSYAGLLAHGRGEAFDYILGEKTCEFAEKSIEAAAVCLLLSQQPIISTNGNSAILSAKDFIQLARLLNCKIEVNLFHRTQERIEKIEKYFEGIAPDRILLSKNKKKIAIRGIASSRKTVLRNGIAKADTILVPLEDGDRCEHLMHLGKNIIAIDLNPMSRTAQTATITIIDNIVRAMPVLIKKIKSFRNLPPYKLNLFIKAYDNHRILSEALIYINKRLHTLAIKDKVG